MWYLVATILLIQDSQVSDEVLKKAFPVLENAMTVLLCEWQVMDYRERIYFFRSSDKFPSDVRFMRKRLRDVNDAPGIHWSFIFPPSELIDQWLEINWKRQSQLRDVLLLPGVQDELDRCKKIQKILDIAKTARNTLVLVSYRREALEQLQKAIGKEDFEKGRLPYPIPSREEIR